MAEGRHIVPVTVSQLLKTSNNELGNALSSVKSMLESGQAYRLAPETITWYNGITDNGTRADEKIARANGTPWSPPSVPLPPPEYVTYQTTQYNLSDPASLSALNAARSRNGEAPVPGQTNSNQQQMSSPTTNSSGVRYDVPSYVNGQLVPGNYAPGTPQTFGTPSGSTSSSGGSSFNASTVGLPPEFQELYSQLETYLAELNRRGQVLNPNIEITPEQVLQFTQQAESEINPYFSGQLKLSKESLMNSLGYTKDEILRSEADAERKYGRNLQGVGETMAESGFAQSGRRNIAEQDLAYDTQRSLEDTRRQFAQSAGNAARSFAQQFGTSELPSISMGAAPTVTPGSAKFGRTASELPLYQLSGDVYNGLIGEQEFARRGSVKTRASELEGAFRSNEALKQARALTL